MNKTVIFDLFGVVFSRGLASSIDSLAQVFDRDRARITEAYTRNEPSFDEGEIDEQEFWQRINNALDTRISPDVLSNIVISSYRLNHDVIRLAQYLKRGLHVVVYSNFRRQWFNRLDRLHNVSTCFDEVYISSDSGIMKPSHEAFELVARQTNTDPDNIALIDDSTQNVLAIETWGGHGIHFTSPYTAEIQLRRELAFTIPSYDAQYVGILLRTRDGAPILQRGNEGLRIGSPEQLTTPGGILKSSESPIEFGIRKLKEATDVQIKPEQMCHLTDLSCPLHENQWVHCTFFQADGVNVETVDLSTGKQFEVYHQDLISGDSNLTRLTRALLEHLAAQ